MLLVDTPWRNYWRASGEMDFPWPPRHTLGGPRKIFQNNNIFCSLQYRIVIGIVARANDSKYVPLCYSVTLMYAIL